MPTRSNPIQSDTIRCDLRLSLAESVTNWKHNLHLVWKLKNELEKADGADEADEEGSREEGRWRE